MSSENRFGMLRGLLRTIGLSPQKADDVVNFIVELLEGERQESTAGKPEFPYELRQQFLSAAELNFYSVLHEVVGAHVVICPKVRLIDLFNVKPTSDQSKFAIARNKIDRKHVDFVLCKPVTMRPLAGIELDDRSHQQKDRQERDAFVDEVFKAAGLPLVHVSAKRIYATADLMKQFQPFLGQYRRSQKPKHWLQPSNPNLAR